MDLKLIGAVLKDSLRMTPEDRITFLTFGLAPEEKEQPAIEELDELPKSEIIPTFFESYCCKLAKIEPRPFNEKEENYVKKWVMSAGKWVSPEKSSDIDVKDPELYFYLESDYFQS